ncbi:MAG: hypothetical protein Q4F65_10370 [Propionibacteriaceae bacterium]|nr:hypothetical protein [Propionibacteriaceae bacterium]
MNAPAFPQVPLSRTIASLAGRNLLVVEDYRTMVLTLTQPSAEVVGLRLRVFPYGLRREDSAAGHFTLAEWAATQGLAPVAAYGVPGVDWWTTEEPQILTGQGPISPGEARALAGSPAADAPAPPPTTRAIAARVDAVKEAYGRLRGDLAYRIENAALFDPAVPQTAQFETALVLWADVEPSTPAAEVARRASVVQVTFETARAHAETVGLRHLPADARRDAERAAKAARLAHASDSDAERRAALARVTAILGSLALYYLPDPAAVDRALTAGPTVHEPDAVGG